MAPSLDLDAAGTSGDGVEAEASTVTRVRVLTFAALGSVVTGYAAVAALLALVTAIAPLAHFSTAGVVAAALPGWLAAHQVPIAISGLELGVLPLAATIGVLLIAARAATGAAERLELRGPWQAGQAVGAIAAAHGGCGVAIALAVSDHGVSIDPLAAFYYPAFLAGIAAALGVLRCCGLWDALLARAEPIALHGLRAGLLAVLSLLAAGGAVLTFALATSVPTARELFAVSAPGLGNGLGMLLLSIGFVPNAVVAAVAFVAGPGFSMGAVSVAPLDFSGGPVPAMPLLAALPVEPAAWWPALFALPLGVGVLVGRRLRDAAEEPTVRLRGAAIAAGVVAVVFVVLAGCAGGRVGVGPFDPVNLHAATVSLALALWVGIPAAVTAWLSGSHPMLDDPPGLLDEPPLEPDADTDAESDAEAESEPDVDTAAESLVETAEQDREPAAEATEAAEAVEPETDEPKSRATKVD